MIIIILVLAETTEKSRLEGLLETIWSKLLLEAGWVVQGSAKISPEYSQ